MTYKNIKIKNEELKTIDNNIVFSSIQFSKNHIYENCKFTVKKNSIIFENCKFVNCVFVNEKNELLTKEGKKKTFLRCKFRNVNIKTKKDKIKFMNHKRHKIKAYILKTFNIKISLKSTIYFKISYSHFDYNYCSINYNQDKKIYQTILYVVENEKVVEEKKYYHEQLKDLKLILLEKTYRYCDLFLIKKNDFLKVYGVNGIMSAKSCQNYQYVSTRENYKYEFLGNYKFTDYPKFYTKYDRKTKKKIIRKEINFV